MVAYAGYISARLKSYSNLQRDVIRDKTDRRAPTRLRSLKVEKGLLREVRETQRMIAAAVEAKFYLDDVDDDVAMCVLSLLTRWETDLTAGKQDLAKASRQGLACLVHRRQRRCHQRFG